MSLLRTAAPVLAPEAAGHLRHGSANADFGMRLADTMTEWGQKHLALLETPSRNSFLQEVRIFSCGDQALMTRGCNPSS